MKIQEIIDFLEAQGSFVNYKCTRDHVLIGQTDKDVEHVIVCWVATLDVIQQAIDKNCHFIISHENPFYLASTNMHTTIVESQKQKQELCKKHDITIYRCHDLWDLYSHYGVRDQWAQLFGFPIEPMQNNGYYRVLKDINMSCKDLAKHIAHCIKPLGENGTVLIGEQDKMIQRLAIGTGACTDVFLMNDEEVDACLVSDDGINNWVSVQWAVDHHMPLIVVNHMTSEAKGLEMLAYYLSQEIKSVSFEYIPNDYGIQHIIAQ